MLCWAVLSFVVQIIPTVHVIGIRSKTKLPKEMLEKATNLMAVGCFCIGTDTTDLKVAANMGVPVSAPTHLKLKPYPEALHAGMCSSNAALSTDSTRLKHAFSQLSEASISGNSVDVPILSSSQSSPRLFSLFSMLWTLSSVTLTFSPPTYSLPPLHFRLSSA